jgi:DNA-binding GntR family transcriptional regulator
VRARLDHVQTTTLGDQAHAALTKAVLTGDLPPGTRLVETEISSWLGISRGPLREAMRRLEADGLIVVQPRRGAYVIDPDGHDVRELYQVRAALEGFAVAAALDEVRASLLDALEAKLDELGDAARAERWMDVAILDSAWHEPLVEAAGNARLVRIWRTVNGPLLALFAQSARDVYAPDDVRRRHEELLDSLRDESPAAVEAAIRDHYLRTAESFAVRADARHADAPTPDAPDTDRPPTSRT